MNDSTQVAVPIASKTRPKPTLAEFVALVDSKEMSAATVTREHGIPRWKIYCELKKLRGSKGKQAKRSGLVPVRLKAPSNSTAFELHLSGGHRLVVPNDFDESALRRLMGVLAGC